MARRRQGPIELLNNTSFLDTMANSVGALAFILFMVVVVTVALKLNYLDLRITTERLPDAVQGKPYDVMLAAEGGNEPYQWKHVSGTLPRGLDFRAVPQAVFDQQYQRTVTATAGRIFGVPQEATRGPVTLTFELDDTPLDLGEGKSTLDQPAVRRAFELVVQPPGYRPQPLIIKTAALPTAPLGKDYSVHLSAVGGAPPYQWSVEGALPEGLSLDAADGRLSGTPLRAGQWSFVAQVRDSAGNAARNPARLLFRAAPLKDEEEVIAGIVKPLVITTERIPDALANADYSLTLAAAGGVPPYFWSLAAGQLPAGLALAADGRIMGKPTAVAQDVRLEVRVTGDPKSSRAGQASKSLSITVRPEPAKVAPLKIF